MKEPLATFVLHAYQPINQKEEVLERIVKGCYRPFFMKLLENVAVKITLNVTGCLVELLNTHHPEIIELIKDGVNNGQIEIMGSAYYHPLLPILTEEEMNYHIIRQKKLIKNVFNTDSHVFFPPELAVSKKVLDVIRKNGYTITIAPANVSNNKFGGIFNTSFGKLLVLKRHKNLSNAISFSGYGGDFNRAINDIKNYNAETNRPVIYAMDLETYGEHIKEYYNFFFHLVNKIKLLKLSTTAKSYPLNEELIDFSPSSWSTSDEDLQNNVPYPLWSHPENPIHHLQHLHIGLLREAKKLVDENNNDKVSTIYHAAFYSCQFWWATNWWSPELIIEGLKMQRKALRAVLNITDNRTKTALFNLSNKILENVKKIIAYRQKVGNK